jgi:hypothetical protein
MAGPIQDLIESLQQVPMQFAKRFTEMLSSMAKYLVEKGYESFQKQMLQQHPDQVTGTGQQPKQFRRAPFIPDELSGKDKQIVPKELDVADTTPTPRPR